MGVSTPPPPGGVHNPSFVYSNQAKNESVLRRFHSTPNVNNNRDESNQSGEKNQDSEYDSDDESQIEEDNFNSKNDKI